MSEEIDINKLNKIISEVMYPKKGNSKMYTNISGSISSTEFCSSISNIIRMLEEDTIIDIAELFKVFADSTRVKIINALLLGKLCVGDIATIINTSQSAVSHQLRILKSAKLVKYTKVGKTVYYELSDDHVKTLFNMGKEHINEI